MHSLEWHCVCTAQSEESSCLYYTDKRFTCVFLVYCNVLRGTFFVLNILD